MKNYNLFYVLLIVNLVIPCKSMEDPRGTQPTQQQIEKMFTIVSRKKTDGLKDFIAKGGNINVKNAKGESLLHVAVIRDNIPAARLILGAPNIDVNDRDGNGDTPLLIAVRVQNPEMVELLLQHRVEVDAPNTSFGNTPLYLAISYELPEIVKLLLNVNAHLYAPNRAGETPFQLALRTGNKQIIKLLKKKEGIKEQESSSEEEPLIISPPVREPTTGSSAPIESTSPGAGGYIPSRGGPAYTPPSLPIHLPQWPGPEGEPKREGPKWSDPFQWAVGGLILDKVLDRLGLVREPIPQVRNETDLYLLLSAALQSKQYEYAYKLVKNNPQAAAALSANAALKEDLKELIEQTEHDLVKETIEAQKAWHPLARLGRPVLSIPLKHLTDLLYLIEYPAMNNAKVTQAG